MQLTGLHFDNQTLRVLPLEKVPENPRLVEPVRQVKGACFSPIKPEPVRAPKLVVASRSCLKLLGLGPEQVFAFSVIDACLHSAAFKVLFMRDWSCTGPRCRICPVFWRK